jgi:membrane-associated phospholipid phosphatase
MQPKCAFWKTFVFVPFVVEHPDSPDHTLMRNAIYNLTQRLRSMRRRVLGHPAIVRFAARYPKAYGIILGRFSIKSFSGLPLTMLSVVFVGNLLILTELAEDFQHSTTIQQIDSRVSAAVFQLRSDALDKVIYNFTFLASTIAIVSMVSMFGIFLFLKKQFLTLVGLLIASIGAGITSALGKLYFQRARPSVNAYYVEPTYSFPSGHSTLTVAFYGFLFYAFILRASGIKGKIPWSIGTMIFLLSMGFSRIYLGVHYFSDVLAGYSLGLLWLLLSIAVIEHIRYSTPDNRWKTSH